MTRTEFDAACEAVKADGCIRYIRCIAQECYRRLSIARMGRADGWGLQFRIDGRIVGRAAAEALIENAP